MTTQHNSEIAKKANSLLFGNCPKGCKEKLSTIPEDLEKRKNALINNTLVFQKCTVCGFTAEI